MAIDKNSKAYQSLLNSGYSDQQISDMYNKASSGQSRQEVVKDTTPINPAKSQATASNVDRSWDQGNGNYVYNSSTGYYEKEGTARATQTTPEVKQETPVKQQETTGSTVPEIKQEGVLKPLSQDYYNQTGDDAQNKIRYNLNQYRQSNPGLFSTYEDFKKNFSYDARNDEQKQTLDAWYGEYQKGMEYGAMPTADLYTQYKDGSISTSDLEILKTYNPEKYAELQAQINKGNIIQAYDDTAPAEKQDFQDLAYQYASQLFKRFMSGDGGSEASKFFDEYKANMDSPEMMELQDKQTDLVEQGKNIQDQIASISKDVEKEYEGTGATKSKINAIISDRTYDLQQQLRTINNEYEKYATQYNNRATQYQNEFQLQLQEYQVNMEARNQQMKELGFAMDLMSFETPQQAQERQWDYWVKQQEYTNGNINSKDYDTRYKAALKSVQNLLSQYEGIPMVRSAEQMAQDVLKAIDNGSDLGAELTKINKQIQEKPEYKKLYNATFGGSQGFGQTVSIGGTDYVEYNGKLYTADEFNKQFGNAKGKANYTVVSEDVLKTYSDGREGTFGSFMANSKYNDGNYIGQCGKFVNDYLQSIGAGRPFGNEDIKTREGWVNSDEGKVGTVAVFDYNHNSSDGINHGHVGIVVSAPDKNGDFWVKDANFDTKNPGVIMTRKVNLKDVSLKGFIDPSLDQNGNRVSAGTSATLTSSSNGTTVGGMSKAYEPTRVGLYDKYLNEGTAPTDAKLKAIGGGDLDKGWQIFDAEVADYMEKTGAGSLDKKKNDEINKLRTEMHQQDAYKDYTSMQTYYEKIKNATNNETATAASDVSLLFAYMKMLDPKSIVRESEFATAQNMGSLPTKWHAQLKSAVNGKKLTDAQRTEILNETKTLMDSATYLYNNLLDDYTSMINYGGDASKLGKRGTYVTDEYKTMYGSTNNSEEVNDLTIGMPLTGGATGGGKITTTGGYNISSNWNTAQ